MTCTQRQHLRLTLVHLDQHQHNANDADMECGKGVAFIWCHNRNLDQIGYILWWLQPLAQSHADLCIPNIQTKHFAHQNAIPPCKLMLTEIICPRFAPLICREQFALISDTLALHFPFLRPKLYLALRLLTLMLYAIY